MNIAAQEAIQRKKILKDFVFTGNHIQFNFSILSNFKAQLQQTTGNYPANATAAPGLLLSFKYSVNFNNDYSFITGAEGSLSGRNFNISFYKDDFSPPLIKDYHFKGKDSYLADLVISLPILLEKRILYGDTKFFFIDAGMRLNVSTGADDEYTVMYVANTNNDYLQVAEVDVMANNNAKPWVNIPINAGHGWLLKNNNIMQLAIVSNISFTKFVNGTYQIDIPNKPATKGNYSSTGSYIGLSMNYVFTNANYRIRKEYEKRKKSL